jgi:hypothetical protein
VFADADEKDAKRPEPRLSGGVIAGAGLKAGVVPWRPAEPGEVPTLGFGVLDWITEYLAAPDRVEYEPFVPTREQAQFVLRFYALDPVTGRRKIRRGRAVQAARAGASPRSWRRWRGWRRWGRSYLTAGMLRAAGGA